MHKVIVVVLALVTLSACKEASYKVVADTAVSPTPSLMAQLQPASALPTPPPSNLPRPAL